MRKLSRIQFIKLLGLAGAGLAVFENTRFAFGTSWINGDDNSEGLEIDIPEFGEDIFSYIKRKSGSMNFRMYQQIIGAANEFKEGDKTLGVAASSDVSRINARTLLHNTRISDLEKHSLFEDEIDTLIKSTTRDSNQSILKEKTLGELKTYILSESEKDVKSIMPFLTSDVIASVVKLMSNEELILVGSKVFNPLAGSKIGAKGYMSARIQPNSPTDNIDDICWQVFDAWSYTVGDLVLGTNPVSSEPDSVAKIEAALHDILVTFGLESTLPNCVLSHIDIQAEVEETHTGTTGIWFQSLAGTVKANQTFDVNIDKMFKYASQRKGKYGLYAETGQGADFTNGHGEGFDMVVHESRKYGFLRALKLKMIEGKNPQDHPWVHVNDVAGFIGPEVFKTREQLVRCCLEDTVMGKLHGLAIGLDICSTLHMDVTLDDLDWCIEQVMPANPAYLMALPTKNDPMLSYLTTAFHNHLKIRNQFGYKVNDDMWEFFKQIEIIDSKGNPTEHFGDPVWVYYKFRLAKGDTRSSQIIFEEGKRKIREIKKRGVPIAQGYGEKIWKPEPNLKKQVDELYKDAKVSLWSELSNTFKASIPSTLAAATLSTDRKDYVYHPESGEKLNRITKDRLKELRASPKFKDCNIQIIISDGLNARALMDKGHLLPYLDLLHKNLKKRGYRISPKNLLITNGRVRAGYRCGEILFGDKSHQGTTYGIIHIIGERPGSGHHNFSAYLSAAPGSYWSQKGKMDHDISRVVSGISDTALTADKAAKETAKIFDQLFQEAVEL